MTVQNYYVRLGTRTGQFANAPETRPIDQSSVPLLTYMNRYFAVSMCSAPRLSPVLTAMLRQDQSRRFEWDGRGYGTVSRSRWRCLRNRCSSDSRSGVNLDRCLVQDLSFRQRFLTLMIQK